MPGMVSLPHGAIMKPILQILRKPWVRTVLAVPLVYGLIGFLGLPWLVRHQLPPRVGQLLQRPLSIGAVNFNPFLLRLELRDTTLTEGDGQPLFALQRLLIDFELLDTLRNRAPTFAELRLERPMLQLVQEPDGTLNLSRLIDDLPDSPEPATPAEDSPPPRLVLQRIVLADGRVALENRASEPPIANQAEHLDLELKNLSTLPARAGRYAVDAALPDGGSLRWSGELSLNPVRSSGTVTVAGLKLAMLWHWAQDRLALAEPAGDLELSSRYAFAQQEGENRLQLEETRVLLKGLQLATAEPRRPLLALDTLRIDPARIDLGEQTVAIPAITLEKGQLDLVADANGELNWLTLLGRGQPAATPAAPSVTPPTSAAASATGEPGRPWSIRLGAFQLKDLAIGYRAEPNETPVEATIGSLGLAFGAEATLGGTAAPDWKIGDIGLQLRQISLRQAQDPLLQLDDIRLERASIDGVAHAIHAPLLAIGKGHIGADIDPEGRLNWRTLLPPAPDATTTAPTAPEPPAADTPAGQPWQLALDELRLDGLGLELSDASRAAPIMAQLGELGLTLKAAASLDAAAPQVRVEGLNLQLNRLAIAELDQDAPLLAWDVLRLEDGHADLGQREAGARRLLVQGGGTALAREAGGDLYPLSSLRAPAAESPAPTSQPPRGTTASTAPPWHYSLGEVAIQDFDLGIRDQTRTPPLAYDLDGLTLSVRAVDNRVGTPMPFTLAARVRQGGQLRVNGSAAQSGESARARIELERFDLRPLQGMLDEHVALRLEAANLSTQLALDYRNARPAPQVRVSGGASLANLKLTQGRDGGKFLSWDDLIARGIDFSLAPDRLAVKELKLIGMDSVIAIREDKRSNIGDILKTPDAGKPAAAAPPPLSPARPAATPAFPVAVNRLLISGGRVDFSDASLVLPFATRVHDLSGSIAGFSLTPKSRATIQLAGHVDAFGEARVDGSLSPLDAQQFSDIGVAFRNVAMTSLSPYSATFAGRTIESGKLDLDLLYRIEDRQLKSQNKLVLEQFRLGERVESPNATALPLDLAVALLTDANGRIQVSVPIEGRLDDPRFAYGKVIGEAFATLVRNIVSAPFNALAALIPGGSSGDPGTVAFDPGRAELPPPEREKLQKLAGMLAGKPGLKLTVHGGVDDQADTLALKWLAVRRAVARELDVPLAPDETPDSVNVTDPASQRSLEMLAAAGQGGEHVAAAYVRDTGRNPQRVGRVAGWFGQGSQTPDFYERLLDWVVEHAVLPPGALAELADRRARAVMAELTERQRFDRARLVQGPAVAAKATEDGRVAIALELDTD